MAEAGTATVGVDLGATKVASVLFGRDGEILETDRRPTEAQRGAEHVMETVLDSVHELTSRRTARVSGVGVGVAAQVDRQGTVRFAPNLRWRDFPIGPALSKRLAVPVAVLNDVRAATLAEWKHGAGRGESDLVCLFLGTGLGGGVVSGGRLLTGSTNCAGELGHLTVEAGGRKCTCPNSGCLEAYVSGWAIAERARELADREGVRAGALRRLAEGPPESLDAKAVIELARTGDPAATQLLEETREYLTAGLVGIANSINPRLVIAGGGLLAGAPGLFEGAFAEARARILPSAAEGLRSAWAELGPDAVAVGAAAWARGEGQ